MSTRAGTVPLSDLQFLKIYFNRKRLRSTTANLKKMLAEAGGDAICNGSIFLWGDQVKKKGYPLHKAKALRQQLGVNAPTVEQLVGNLSGGNQQKVLVGKWIFAEPDVLLLDEPTRGVDVGAKYEIYQIINDLVAQGKAVLMISSELPEILGMCDRVYIMNEGRVIAQVSAREATQESIMGYIMQDSKKEIGA